MKDGAQKVEILGIPIDAVTENEALDAIADFLAGGTGRKVFTPNPEMLVLARKRPLFREALQAADLAIPDGVGLLWAARILGKRLPARVTGTDMVDRICALASKTGKSVFLLGGGPGVAESAAGVLKVKHPGLRIAGAISGGDVVYDAEGKPSVADEVMRDIGSAAPDMMFVAFGHGKQEEWIHSNLHLFPSIRVAAGVGGAFDFLSGKARRAPARMRKSGLEWLWRLILQPRRLGRILTATVVFPLLVAGERLGFLKIEPKS